MTLNDLKQGQAARVARIGRSDPDLEAKLRDIGFAEHDEVELLQRGPIGGSPLSVRVNRTIIALRTREAAAIEVSAAA